MYFDQDHYYTELMARYYPNGNNVASFQYYGQIKGLIEIGSCQFSQGDGQQSDYTSDFIQAPTQGSPKDDYY